MRDLFPGFYNRTDEELFNVWKEGTFVFDTNMLLHVYEYSLATRERFFETLSKLQERIWIPYQVAFEYQRRRMKVIIRQRDSYKSVNRHLDKALQFLKDGLEPYKKDKHAFIDTEDLINRVSHEIAFTKTEIQRAGSRHPDYKVYDPFREKLEKLFAGRVGNDYDNETLKMKYGEAQHRLDNIIPPGFEDEGKDPIERYGDILVWFQIIDYARSEKKPVIFITDDIKKDWWIPQGESYDVRKPRPELIQEMYIETGMLFHMYEGYGFMDEAQKYLKLEAKPEVIEEIKEIGQQDTMGLIFFDMAYSSISNLLSSSRAVLRWLEKTFPKSKVEKVISFDDNDTDFISIASDGTKTGFQIKVFDNANANPYNMPLPIWVNRLLRELNDNKKTPQLDKLVLVMICDDRETAIIIAEKLQKQPVISPNTGFIVGFIGGDGAFMEVFGLY